MASKGETAYINPRMASISMLTGGAKKTKTDKLALDKPIHTRGVKEIVYLGSVDTNAS